MRPSAPFCGPLLGIVLHCSGPTLPSSAQVARLKAAGVSAIIAEDQTKAMIEGLPVIDSRAEAILVDGTRWSWIRGDRATLIELASAARTRYIATLPCGGAQSVSSLSRSCLLAWQLKSLRCSAIVLPWSELEVAARSGGWDCITQQLLRMRESEMTMIHGG